MRPVLVECEPLELNDQDGRQGEKEALALRGDGHALEGEPAGWWMTRGRSVVKRR